MRADNGWLLIGYDPFVKAKRSPHLIGTKPGGTSPAIAGTRVRVANIAQMYRRLQDEATVEYILRELPDLTLEQVQAALEYWRAHPDEIQQEIDEDLAVLAEMDKTGGILLVNRRD